jgi:hypothetical protein
LSKKLESGDYCSSLKDMPDADIFKQLATRLKHDWVIVDDKGAAQATPPTASHADTIV